MQPPSDSHQPHASADVRLAEQGRQIQQLWEQLARASVKEGPTLHLLSVLEPNKAHLPKWMRPIVCNIKAYLKLRAAEVSEVSRLVEFKGEVACDIVDAGGQLVWRTLNYINQCPLAYARRHAGSTSNTRHTD